MFYVLSKTLWFVAQPSFFIFVLITVGFLLILTRWSKIGNFFASSGIILFFICGLTPLAHILMLPLEDRFSRPDIQQLKQQRPDGIIVLGGAINPTLQQERGTIALNEAGERIIDTVILANAFKDTKVIFTGGAAVLLTKPVAEAGAAQSIFENLGLNKNQIVLENTSRNTYENAVFTKNVLVETYGADLRGKRFVMITSAYHMPRAVGSFRKVGLDVVPWPVDYRTRGWQDAFRFFSSPADGLKRMDVAVKEWIGLLAYWITGRTTALFPGERIILR